MKLITPRVILFFFLCSMNTRGLVRFALWGFFFFFFCLFSGTNDFWKSKRLINDCGGECHRMTQTGHQIADLDPQAIGGLKKIRQKTAERKCWNSCKSTSRNSRMMLEPPISINPLKRTPSLINRQPNKINKINHRTTKGNTKLQIHKPKGKDKDKRNKKSLRQVVDLASLQVSSFPAPKHHFLSSLLRSKLIPGPCFPTLLPRAFHRRENVLGIRNHSW